MAGSPRRCWSRAATALPLPEGRSFEDGSALILTYATTIHALLDRGKLKEGETLLVLGAAGGVGLAAVELGKAYGARVVAAVSSEEKAEAARGGGRRRGDRLSARAVRQGRREGAGAAVQGGGRPKGADLVYDPVGGDYTEAAVRALGLGGAAAGDRLPGRNPEACRSTSPCSRAATCAASSGAPSPRATRRPMPPMSRPCSELWERGQDRAEGQPDLAAGAGRRGDRPHGGAQGGRQARRDDGLEVSRLQGSGLAGGGLVGPHPLGPAFARRCRCAYLAAAYLN